MDLGDFASSGWGGDDSFGLGSVLSAGTGVLGTVLQYNTQNNAINHNMTTSVQNATDKNGNPVQTFQTGAALASASIGGLPSSTLLIFVVIGVLLLVVLKK